MKAVSPGIIANCNSETIILQVSLILKTCLTQWLAKSPILPLSVNSFSMCSTNRVAPHTHLMDQGSGMKLNLRASVCKVWFTPSISITAAAPLWKREEGTLWKFCERIAYTPYLSHSVQSQVYESQLPVGLQCLADSNCAGDINVLSPRAHKRQIKDIQCVEGILYQWSAFFFFKPLNL